MPSFRISCIALLLSSLPAMAEPAAPALSARDCAALWQAYSVAHDSCRAVLDGTEGDTERGAGDGGDGGADGGARVLADVGTNVRTGIGADIRTGIGADIRTGIGADIRTGIGAENASQAAPGGPAGVPAVSVTPVAGAATAAPPRARPPLRHAGMSAELLQNNLIFSTGSATLGTDLQTRIAFLARVLETTPLRDGCLRLVGHANRGPNDDPADNMTLSRDRAEAVATALRAILANPARVVEVAGVGDARPLAGRPASAPENRRVTIYARRCR
ncbi:OmpA family protein [Mesobaculum littorinae]|uniref:OmpA family protein n=1 Tax=Mesobaculum littorinae TaxID=2486419 RepID=A0A438ACY5_9RHOB|nr:OmpA family protein [Mesobaculum littorinae]RVV96551.1 OmpA family protein [Mesobaculum littorinae]